MLATSELIGEAVQLERLGDVLPRWLDEVPLYRDGKARPNFSGTGSWLDKLRRLPLITKADIRRDFPRNFLRPGTELEALLEDEAVELEHTSGTSEERTPLLLGKGWWGEQEERALRLNPLAAEVLELHPAARRVTISSPVCNGDIRYTGVPSKTDRVVGNALFINLTRFPFIWSENDLARMTAETLEWDPIFLDVDPVYGVLFALHCERHQIRLPSLKFILASYEFVSIAHRRVLERVFGVPVFNLYGSTETGHLLMEDGCACMQPSFETAFLEVLNVDAHGIGELVVTTLTNDFMPLVRYQIGDLVEQRAEPYGTSYLVHGRTIDALTSAEGKRVTTRQIDQCFAGLSGIVHYQLLEHGPGDWLLRYVPDRISPSAPDLFELEARLAQWVGPAGKLTLETTDLLMPESSGKFRLGYPASVTPRGRPTQNR